MKFVAFIFIFPCLLYFDNTNARFSDRFLASLPKRVSSLGSVIPKDFSPNKKGFSLLVDGNLVVDRFNDMCNKIDASALKVIDESMSDICFLEYR